MNIRLEKTEDYREVENLTREAFWNVYRPGCTEHYVLNQYRTSPDFIPELDFVMEENGKIIGHVMFSKAEIMLDDGTSFLSWTFGPISIHPDYKRKGYGLKLLQYALEKAKEMGIGLIQMEGNIEFYKHAGFEKQDLYLDVEGPRGVYRVADARTISTTILTTSVSVSWHRRAC